MQEIRLSYEEVISNYATTIDNLHRNEENSAPSTPPTPQGNSPRMEFDYPDPEDFIRMKNHTFGMKQVSNRSSKE